MSKYSKIKHAMQDMISFFNEFSNILQEKIEAIEQSNVTKLEEIMKREQAFSMKIRGLEKAREMALDELGMTVDSFRDMAQSPADDEEQEISAVYFVLKAKLDNYALVSDAIKAQVDIKLHSIKILLEKLEKNTARGIYDKNGADAANSANEFKSTKA